MSKQQAILETLLGAAELSGNLPLVNRIRLDLAQVESNRRSLGYQRIEAAAGEAKRPVRKAA
jgi:hypothetical protein